MTDKQIKEYFLKLTETEKIDFYNIVVCELCSSDDMIFYNDKFFFENQFINKLDSEQSKLNQLSNYNINDKFIRMIEYKKLESSNDILQMIDLKVFIDLVKQYYTQLYDIGLFN